MALKINDQNAIISLYNFLSYIPIHHLCNISRNLSEYLRYTWYGSAIRKVFRLDRRARACGSNRNQSTFGSADKITCPFQRLNLAKKTGSASYRGKSSRWKPDIPFFVSHNRKIAFLRQPDGSSLSHGCVGSCKIQVNLDNSSSSNIVMIGPSYESCDQQCDAFKVGSSCMFSLIT